MKHTFTTDELAKFRREFSCIKNAYTFVFDSETNTASVISCSTGLTMSRNNGFYSFTPETKNRWRPTQRVRMHEVNLHSAVLEAVRNVKKKPAVTVNTQSVNVAPVVSKHGWIIGTQSDNKIGLASVPMVHTTVQSVDAELNRLAKLRPGDVFVKLKIEAKVSVPPQTPIWS